MINVASLVHTLYTAYNVQNILKTIKRYRCNLEHKKLTVHAFRISLGICLFALNELYFSGPLNMSTMYTIVFSFFLKPLSLSRHFLYLKQTFWSCYNYPLPISKFNWSSLQSCLQKYIRKSLTRRNTQGILNMNFRM